MTEVVFRAVDLTKVYRLYTRPAYRFLDMFGLLGNKPGAYTEHAALDRLNLQVRRGEKVAIIGRNGAGKSTFLKLVTGVIEPTAGRIDVRGKVHALLQIGTGFHPEFTGRENVYAYFAQLGISAKEADDKCAEVVEFAELEEYIDQPVKTYSTGMAVRLMFSAATVITPDLLVLDEVLGVGDAYFAQKSYDRMKELCDGAGTTLLLVTHDIYSALKMCSRTLWIDRGRILLDGDGPTVVKAYEESIRQQEEARLRLRKQEKLRALEKGQPVAVGQNHVILEIYSRDNKPQPSPVYFSRIALLADGIPVAEAPLGSDAFADEASSHLQREATRWGEPVFWEGRLARPMLNYGSPFHKVAAVLAVPGAPLGEKELTAAVEYWAPEPCDLSVRCFQGNREQFLGRLPAVAGQWTGHTAPVDLSSGVRQVMPAEEMAASGRHGTGAIAVLDVKTVNADGEEAHFFEHGKPFDVLIWYQIHRPGLLERAQVLLAFHRDGLVDTCRVLTKNLLFDAAKRPHGVVRLHVPRLILANGTYTVTVMVAQEGYYDRFQTRYFSLNPEVYTCLSRVLEIVVREGGIVGTGTGVVFEAEWSLVDPESIASTLRSTV